MRNRLNVRYQGRRTTARFPEYLWLLALRASGNTDSELCGRVKAYLLAMGDEFQDTASEATIVFLVNCIDRALADCQQWSPAGFNPGHSRALPSTQPPKASAAGARP